MSDPAPSLKDLLVAFDADVAAHKPLLAALHAGLEQPASPVDTPLAPPPLKITLRAFDLDVKQAAILAADPGWGGDFVIFASGILKRIDPSLRAEFPAINTFIESAVPVPGAPLLIGLLLSLVEGPLLALVEGWLQDKANSLLAAEKAAGDLP